MNHFLYIWSLPGEIIVSKQKISTDRTIYFLCKQLIQSMYFEAVWRDYKRLDAQNYVEETILHKNIDIKKAI